MITRRKIVLALGAGALAPLASYAQLQTFPTKPIRMLIGFSAGSTTDVLARMVGQKIAEAWGQQVVVDNRPSFAGVVASTMVTTAPPDGMIIAGGVALSFTWPLLSADWLVAVIALLPYWPIAAIIIAVLLLPRALSRRTS